jgi:hypothetical protein
MANVSAEIIIFVLPIITDVIHYNTAWYVKEGVIISYGFIHNFISSKTSLEIYNSRS